MGKGLLALLFAASVSLMSCATLSKSKEVPPVPPANLTFGFYGEGIFFKPDTNNDGKINDLDSKFYYKIFPHQLEDTKMFLENPDDKLPFIFVYRDKKISPFGKLVLFGYYPRGIVIQGDVDRDNKFDDRLYYMVVFKNSNEEYGLRQDEEDPFSDNFYWSLLE